MPHITWQQQRRTKYYFHILHRNPIIFPSQFTDTYYWNSHGHTFNSKTKFFEFIYKFVSRLISELISLHRLNITFLESFQFAVCWACSETDCYQFVESQNVMLEWLYNTLYTVMLLNIRVSITFKVSSNIFKSLQCFITFETDILKFLLFDKVCYRFLSLKLK